MLSYANVDTIFNPPSPVEYWVYEAYPALFDDDEEVSRFKQYE